MSNQIALHDQQVACCHCQNKCEPSNIWLNNDQQAFCCQGCLSVYSIISKYNLNKFYDLSSDFKINQVLNHNLKSQEYSYLDSQDFIQKHIVFENNHYEFSFYLEGIHCLACLWLIEKLPELIPEVLSARLNLGKNTVKIIASKGISFSHVAIKLYSLGYKPHPILEQSDGIRLQKEEEKKDFLKLGVAAFCAMNNMLYAISIYSGADGIWKLIFNYINFALSLPVVFFCAIPFYSSAINSFKNKVASIDTPIAVAIIAGFSVSVINLFYDGHLYFDSITILVFFLLLSRVILKNFQSKHLNQSDITSYFLRTDIKRWNKKTNLFEFVQESELHVGDLIKVKKSEIIPCDGIVDSGESNVQMSVLSGEPIPISIKKGDFVFAGTTNVGNDFLIKATAIGIESKLGKILSKVKENLKRKAPIATLLEQVSRYFIILIFIVSAISAVYFYINYGLFIAIERSLTLLIVTCPCALALATPLSFSKAFSLCQKYNLVVKDETTFEKANKITNIFLDKTGTITNGNFQVTKWEALKKDSINFDLKEIIYKMEENSKHHLANSIISYLDRTISHKSKQNLPEIKVTEIIGQGIETILGQHKFTLSEIEKNPNRKILGLTYNNQIILKIELKDNIQQDNLSVLAHWKKLFNLYLISGDNKIATTHLGKLLKLPLSNIYSQQSPSEKAKVLSTFKNTLMIGDGVNDTLAFTKAMLSISVFGSVESSLQTADVFCLSSGLNSIDKLFTISKETLIIIKRNILFSIGYNILTIYLVFTGHISPLIAAILMPISSLSVIFSTIIGTKKLRQIDTPLANNIARTEGQA